MNKEDRSKIFETMRGIYKNSPVPTALLDTEFKIIWANNAALVVAPSFTRRDGLFLLLPASFSEDIFKTAEKKGPGEVMEIPILFTDDILVLMPLEPEGGGGYILQFTKKTSSSGSALHPEGAQKLVSAFSGSFRGPLASIFSVLSALGLSTAAEEYPELEEYYDKISRSAYCILRNSTNMTEYIRRQTGTADLNRSYVDFGKMLEELCNAVNIVAGETGILVTCEAEKDIYLYCDSAKITFAVLQLISNSCRFTEEGNEVFLGAKRVGNRIVVTVKDGGRGIPFELQSRVFDPFFSHSPDGTPFAGFGLGLSLFKDIVVLHGGTVTLTSEPGEGTTIVFTLAIIDAGEAKLSSHNKLTDYLYDRFSPVYVQMCDSCRPPKA